MNANEIVRALRNCKAYKTKSDLQTTMLMAADLIESLQAQLKESQEEAKKQHYLAFEMAGRADEAQRRERAAVEDLKKLDRREPFGGRNCANKSECYEENRKIGGNYPECANCTEWQWRGPQAGEGGKDG